MDTIQNTITLTVAALLALLTDVSGDLPLAATYDGGYGHTNVVGVAPDFHPRDDSRTVAVLNGVGEYRHTADVTHLREALQALEGDTEVWLLVDGGLAIHPVKTVAVGEDGFGRPALVANAI